MYDNLFRVWDKKRKKMIYNSMDIEIEPKDRGKLVYSDIGDIAIGMDGTLYLIDKCGNYEYAGNLGEDYEIMFYTGLKDKNRKAIYAGDIIKVNMFDEPMVVYFKDGYFGWGKYHHGKYSSFDPFGSSEEIEVLGNIYENSDLLEKIEKEGI